MTPERSMPFFPQRSGLCVLVFFAVVLSSFGQSVAEVARKERLRQQGAKSSVVITSTEGPAAAPARPPEAPPSALPAPGSSAAGAAAAPAKPGEITDRNGHDEKYWRAAFQKAREDAKRAESRAELLDLKIKQLNSALLQAGNVYNRENRIGPEITTAQKELEDARKEADLAKKKISDLEDELRKAGGPAGWAR